MTLNTSIYLHGQVDIPEFFTFCQRALLAFDEGARSLDEVVWSDKEGYFDKSIRCRANQLGQGLPAVLDFTYRPDAPLLTVEQAAEHNDYCNEDGDCDGSGHKPPHWDDLGPQSENAAGWLNNVVMPALLAGELTAGATDSAS